MWKLLGLHPDDHLFGIELVEDRELLEKAYAAQLEKISPQTMPDEFKALKSEYEDALRYLKFKIDIHRTWDEKDYETPSLEELLALPDEENDIDDLLQYINEVRQLSWKSPLSQWEALFNKAFALSSLLKSSFELELGTRLTEWDQKDNELVATKYPLDFYILLNKHFGWREKASAIPWSNNPNAAAILYERLCQIDGK